MMRYGRALHKSVEQAVVADVRYQVVVVTRTVRIMVDQGLDKTTRTRAKLSRLLVLRRF
jgi:hypothetical protein